MIRCWMIGFAVTLAFAGATNAATPGLELKALLKDDIERAALLATKIKAIRDRKRGNHGAYMSPETNEFLQVVREIDCFQAEDQLIRSIDRDTESSITYLIKGRCVIDRSIEIRGRSLQIASASSATDPSTLPNGLASIVLSLPDGSNEHPRLAAGVGGTLLLTDVFLENAAGGPMSIAATGSAYVTLYNVGFRGQMNILANRGSGVWILDQTFFTEPGRRQATVAELALASTQAEWSTSFRVRDGGQARVWGGYNVDFNLEGGTTLQHIVFSSSTPATVSYELSTGSSASVINVNPRLTIQRASARSGSVIGYRGIFQPIEIPIVSRSSYIGPEDDRNT